VLREGGTSERGVTPREVEIDNARGTVDSMCLMPRRRIGSFHLSVESKKVSRIRFDFGECSTEIAMSQRLQLHYSVLLEKSNFDSFSARSPDAKSTPLV
jgi:hypothetical protein